MSRKMLIDATHPEETRVVVVDGNRVEEFDFETVNKRQLAGNIYLAKVTRVEPSLQAAFVDYGGNRHGFLAFSEIHPDYYQIPVADREALKAEERALARAEQEAENGDGRRPRRGSRAAASAADPQRAAEAPVPAGMEVIDPGDGDGHPPELEADAADDHDSAASAETAAVSGDDDHDGDHDDDGEGGDDGTAEDDDHPPPSEIESLADNDVSEEISAQRRPRRQKYKIQEVIKVRQILLVQVLKEERGNKGAALTTYLSLAGRYCVLMPNTARGGGISRKITQAADRKKLKEIASQLEVPEGAGLIIRTAGARRTGPEIQRDYEYLMRLWEEVRGLTLRSIAPAPIYQEGDLIKRTIRDLYSRDIDEVLVEGEAGYQSARDFMRMIMPDHARQVKRYDEPMPLFARYQVESFLAGMFNPVVQLKSGGYIVIGITEALVAIDVNSGRATKEGSIEETALKTNLEAADEVARQLRLRDLAGLIVIDFIDMDERRNNAAVEKRLKERLKSDRARIQVGRISGFGLMEMSRQRLHPGMLESTTQPCPHCHGTGLIRSDDSLALTILRAIEEEGTRKRSREVLLKAPVGIVNYLVNHKREHVALIEARYGMAVRIDADPDLVSPDYTLERFKTATRSLPAPSAAISGHAGLMGELVAPDEASDEFSGSDDEGDAPATGDDAGTPTEVAANGSETGDRRKKRRRRRRRPGSDSAVNAGESVAVTEGGEGTEGAPEVTAEAAPESAHAPQEDAPSDEDEKAVPVRVPVEPVAESVAEAPAKPKRVRKPRAPKVEAPVEGADGGEAAPAEGAAEATAEEAPKPKPRRTRAPARPKAAPVAAMVEEEAAANEPAPKVEEPPAAAEVAPAPVATAAEPAAEAVAEPEPVAEAAVGSEPATEAAADATPANEAPAKPRRRGWWNRAG